MHVYTYIHIYIYVCTYMSLSFFPVFRCRVGSPWTFTPGAYRRSSSRCHGRSWRPDAVGSSRVPDLNLKPGEGSDPTASSRVGHGACSGSLGLWDANSRLNRAPCTVRKLGRAVSSSWTASRPSSRARSRFAVLPCSFGAAIADAGRTLPDCIAPDTRTLFGGLAGCRSRTGFLPLSKCQHLLPAATCSPQDDGAYRDVTLPIAIFLSRQSSCRDVIEAGKRGIRAGQAVEQGQRRPFCIAAEEGVPRETQPRQTCSIQSSLRQRFVAEVRNTAL